MKITKVRNEQKTVGISNLRHSRYATGMTQIERQTNRFMQAVSCQGVWLNKILNTKINGWFQSHFQ